MATRTRMSVGESRSPSVELGGHIHVWPMLAKTIDDAAGQRPFKVLGHSKLFFQIGRCRDQTWNGDRDGEHNCQHRRELSGDQRSSDPPGKRDPATEVPVEVPVRPRSPHESQQRKGNREVGNPRSDKGDEADDDTRFAAHNASAESRGLTVSRQGNGVVACVLGDTEGARISVAKGPTRATGGGPTSVGCRVGRSAGVRSGVPKSQIELFSGKTSSAAAHCV